MFFDRVFTWSVARGTTGLVYGASHDPDDNI